MKYVCTILALLICGRVSAQAVPRPPCYPPFAVNWSSSMTSQSPALGAAFIETWFCLDPSGMNGYKGYGIVGYISELLPNWYTLVSSLSTTSKAAMDALWDSNVIDNDHELDGFAQAQLANTWPPATTFLRGLLPPPVTTGSTVYYVIQQADKFVAIPVGTAPVGTVCDMTQNVDNMNGVPRGGVTWYGSVKPLVVVAPCG